MAAATDRVGLGWRPELAAGILSNLDRIDLVEVIADDYFGRNARELRTLHAQVPLVLHGVGLGLASTSAPDAKRLDAMARVVDIAEPEFWSEHLAFVRAGGIEIGHLAAPPRNAALVDATARNVDRARRVVGTRPGLENIATLIDPPASDLGEADWISRVIAASGAGLLLDLHNAYANCLNFGGDASAFVARLPMHAICAIHLGGSKWIAASNGERRLLDDHLHDVPAPVYALLEQVAALAPEPLTVIIERDGNYPPIQRLLDEIDLARAAIARGRARRHIATLAA
ncbi:MAG TPA: DUF692 domain-containing protein [Burkholderiales bacterium]|nr:DUF692 domain-containing protein [Burkholderiales bacterium]